MMLQKQTRVSEQLIRLNKNGGHRRCWRVATWL